MYVQDILRKADKVFESREFFVATSRSVANRFRALHPLDGRTGMNRRSSARPPTPRRVSRGGGGTERGGVGL